MEGLLAIYSRISQCICGEEQHNLKLKEKKQHGQITRITTRITRISTEN